MQKETISRRNFLAGAGILAAGAAGASLAGCSPKSESSKPSAASTEAPSAASSDTKDIWALKQVGEPAETIKADVCVIGAGGTGTAAAVQATDLGMKPVVIERMGGYGGSFIGTEGMTGLETKYTKKESIKIPSAYYPDREYDVNNAMNTCLNYHHWIPQHKLYENFFK